MPIDSKRCILALALVLAASAGVATEQAPSNIDDPYGVLQAMQAGDSARLRVLAATGNAGQRAMATSALYRSQGDLVRSSQASGDCVRKAREASSNDIVLICGLIDAGNDLAMGRPGKWAYKVAFLRQQLYPAFRKTQGPAFSIAPLEYVPRPDDFAHLADAAYALASGGATLALAPFAKGPLAPMSTALANGVEVRSGRTSFQAVFDTGSFMTLLNTPTAQALKATVQPGWMRAGGGSAGHLGVATAADMQIGPLQTKNVSFAVSTSPVLDIIGMDLIQQLGAIRMTATGVRVLPANGVELARCTTPMRVASSLSPTGIRLLLPIKVDGKNELAFLDTGSDEYLTRFGGAQPAAADDMGEGRKEVTMKVGGGVTASERRSAKAGVDLGAGVHERSVRVEKGAADAPFYVVGMPATADADLLIDFRQHHLCVLEASR